MNSDRQHSVLVTGEAGYIGSHVVKQLVDSGETVIVLDNLSNGSRAAIGDVEFHEGDIWNRELVDSILRARRIDTIMHFAAHSVVSESVENPSKYYRNNVGGTASLLHCTATNNIENFVFSSTAAVYGSPETGVCSETSVTAPISPYGQSKLMAETILGDISKVTSMRHVILRSFNVAGAEPSGVLGQRGKQSTHITKIACEVAVGIRDQLEIFGVDFATPDGTGTRDYVHVEDLAAAHVAALHYLRNGGASTILNCGYGRSFSVRQVIEAVQKAARKQLPFVTKQRRAGDPPALVAVVERIKRTLDWTPQFDDLDVIARSALHWERKLQQERRG